MRRFIAPLLLSTLLVTTSCTESGHPDGTYERVAGGAVVGTVSGAAIGFLSSPDNTGKGALIGAIIGMIGGLILQAVDPI